MKITEVVGTNSNMDYIKDLLVYLNIKGVPNISTESVIKELKKFGIEVSYEELEPLIKELDFIEDISQKEVTFKNDAPSDLTSDDKVDDAQATVAAMANRARRQRGK